MKTDVSVCGRCGRVAHFRFTTTGSASTLRCWRHAVVYGPVFRRALQVAAVVGTLLFIINQLGVVLSGMVNSLVLLRIALTYVVPFLVSLYSALSINRLPKSAVAREPAPPATPEAAA